MSERGKKKKRKGELALKARLKTAYGYSKRRYQGVESKRKKPKGVINERKLVGGKNARMTEGGTPYR